MDLSHLATYLSYLKCDCMHWHHHLPQAVTNSNNLAHSANPAKGPCLIRGVQADRGGLAPVLLSWRYSRRLRFIKRAFHYRGGNSMALLDLSEYYAPKKYFQTAQEASQATKA